MTKPPTSVDASKNIAWIKCDVCFYWYHECCVVVFSCQRTIMNNSYAHVAEQLGHLLD